MAYEVGSRVFAVRNADQEKVYLFGKGVYVGDEVPPGWAAKNPCIKLDNDDVVWGFQCWWGPESRFDAWVQGREIVEVPIPVHSDL